MYYHDESAISGGLVHCVVDVQLVGWHLLSLDDGQQATSEEPSGEENSCFFFPGHSLYCKFPRAGILIQICIYIYIYTHTHLCVCVPCFSKMFDKSILKV